MSDAQKAEDFDGVDSGNGSYISMLTREQRSDREHVLAHIIMLEVKREVARGKHAVRMRMNVQRPVGWQSNGDLRATQLAMINKAVYRECPGLLMNLLLDWISGAMLVSEEHMDSICKKFLDTPERVFEAVEQSRRLYSAVAMECNSESVSVEEPGRGTATEFVDALWHGWNFDVSTGILHRLAEATEPPQPNSPTPTDVLILCLAIQIMKMSSLFGRNWVARDIFTICGPWLQQSATAYNILLYPEANAYNMGMTLAILQEMRRNGTMPDAMTWTTIISGMCRNGRTERAMRLFSMHLLFLPHQQTYRSPDGTIEVVGKADEHCLYAPNAVFNETPHLWEQWYTDSRYSYNIESFFALWLKDLANRYHQEQTNGLDRKRSASGSGNVASLPRKNKVIPWLPTLTTHQLMLNYFDKKGWTQQLLKYYWLLKRVWPQYRHWSFASTQAPGGLPENDHAGFRRIERLVAGHLVQRDDGVRTLYGLAPVSNSLARSPSQYGGDAFGGAYYAHCNDILELARGNISSATLPPESRVDPTEYPPRIVYSKALHGYALTGDLRSMLHHMRRFSSLNDIAAWTDIIRCIATQIMHSSNDQLMIFPQLHYKHAQQSKGSGSTSEIPSETWLDFIFDLCHTLALRNICFTQVTFGVVIQLASKLEDMQSLLRTVQYMRQNSTVRFNIEMLLMVLHMDCPFKLKCTLTMQVLSRAGNRRGEVYPEQSTVKPIYALLSRLVKLSKSFEDLTLLKDVIDVLRDNHGIHLNKRDYDHIRQICIESDAQADMLEWVQNGTINNIGDGN
ncbi:hypothetical protein H4R20_000153 [Coemansia guatemalensis]|uniref:Uncharacterized protein n=1 Tax=Coemansia guatemalensis TaxID=2761395 RepID=A0A9W8I6Q2_9FUNG|nr:hypothetical protein H4R20_000153 [Coemansia guatemalensis]